MVSTSFYPLLHPPSAPRDLLDAVGAACAAGDSSVFVSGVDPGWALDILPALISGVGAGITEIRIQEVFNYAPLRPARRGPPDHRLRRLRWTRPR